MGGPLNEDFNHSLAIGDRLRQWSVRQDVLRVKCPVRMGERNVEVHLNLRTKVMRDFNIFGQASIKMAAFILSRRVSMRVVEFNPVSLFDRKE